MYNYVMTGSNTQNDNNINNFIENLVEQLHLQIDSLISENNSIDSLLEMDLEEIEEERGSGDGSMREDEIEKRDNPEQFDNSLVDIKL